MNPGFVIVEIEDICQYFLAVFILKMDINGYICTCLSMILLFDLITDYYYIPIYFYPCPIVVN